MRLIVFIAFIAGWVTCFIVSKIIASSTKKPQKEASEESKIPSVDVFEKYWRENTERIFVRFCNDWRIRCVVYKNTQPWFVIKQSGSFEEFNEFVSLDYYKDVWNIKSLASDKKASAHIADTYLNSTALYIIANPVNAMLPPLVDPALEKAYKELDQYMLENK